MEVEFISSLIDVLQKECEYHKQLCDTARAKKQTIIENDVEKLTEIIEDEKSILNDLDQLENTRKKVLNKIAAELEIDEQPPHYNLIKAEIPDKYRDQLKDVRSKLLEVIEELQKINDQNKSLLEEAIKLNKFNFQLMAEAIDPSNDIYSKNNDDNDNEDNNQHIMDRKA